VQQGLKGRAAGILRLNVVCLKPVTTLSIGTDQGIDYQSRYSHVEFYRENSTPLSPAGLPILDAQEPRIPGVSDVVIRQEARDAIALSVDELLPALLELGLAIVVNEETKSHASVESVAFVLRGNLSDIAVH